jgi:hypothetical protein
MFENELPRRNVALRNMKKMAYLGYQYYITVVRVSGYRSRGPGFDSRRFQIF